MKLKKKQKKLVLILPLIAAVGIFLLGHPALAAWDWAITVVAGLLNVFIWILGVILILVIKGLIIIASYQNFIGSQAVILGWVIVRDVCNMFFVVVLLIIAFGTILHLENYSFKKWLPKLILMAVLINFSKTICGLMIDAAQIIMLTFVNAFKDVGGANLTDILGISNIVTMAKDDSSISIWTVVGAYGLGMIYLMIAVVVIVTMMMMLVMRLVMIWIYVVLSPLAYILSAFPGGEKYASQWWSEFTKNLIVGPVLAFFIWLSFAALQTTSMDTKSADQEAQAEISQTGAIVVASPTSTIAIAGTKATTPASLIQFVIAIGMLLGGLKISQEIGGAAGSIAGKGMAAIQKGQGLALKGGKSLAKWGGRQLGDVRDIVSEKLGVDLNVVAGEKRRREQVEHNRALRQTRIRKSTLTQAEEGKTWVGRKAALLSTGDVAWQNILDRKFTAGSPSKSKNATDEINKQKVIKTAAEDNLKNIDKEAASVVTMAEDKDNKDRIKEIDQSNFKLEGDRDAIVKSVAFKDLEVKEKKRTLTEPEEADLKKKREQVTKMETAIEENKKEKEELGGKTIVVADQTAKAAKIADYENKKKSETSAIADVDAEITKFKDVLRKNQLSEVQSARAEISAKMEGEAAKKISNISNSDQLVGIYKEAEEQHDEGLMAASYKKLAKTANYNELNKELGYGTGYDGMAGMAKRMQTDGGMTEQDALALTAEIGELAKSVNHFEAFGVTTMDEGGKWKLNGKQNQQAAVLSEKSKIQVQQFVRTGNRLGNGSYQNNQPHDAQHWDLSESSIALYASKDKAYKDEIEKTGNINMIQFIGANEANLKKLEKAGAIQVAAIIRQICKKATMSDVSNPLETIRKIQAL